MAGAAEPSLLRPPLLGQVGPGDLRRDEAHAAGLAGALLLVVALEHLMEGRAFRRRGRRGRGLGRADAAAVGRQNTQGLGRAVALAVMLDQDATQVLWTAVAYVTFTRDGQLGDRIPHHGLSITSHEEIHLPTAKSSGEEVLRGGAPQHRGFGRWCPLRT